MEDAAHHHAEAERIYREGLLNGAIANPRITTGTYDYSDGISSSSYRKKMIGMRLRIPNGSLFPFAHLETHYAGEKVFVFVVVDDKPVVLEDESSLFPSDTLITQLRLIQK